MNKQTQMIVGLVAVAGIGYWLWKSGQKPQGFANAVGKGISAKTRTSTIATCGPGDVCSGPGANLCGESCMNGVCNFWIYDVNGNPTKYGTTDCVIK
jgi:hypothetical protein